MKRNEQIDPYHCYTTPGFNTEAMLKFTCYVPTPNKKFSMIKKSKVHLIRVTNDLGVALVVNRSRVEDVVK